MFVLYGDAALFGAKVLPVIKLYCLGEACLVSLVSSVRGDIYEFFVFKLPN